jgi:hypothetical protein
MFFVYAVIIVFILLAIKYFYTHSLSTVIQRNQTLKSAVLCIYFLPVFLLSLYLLYAGVINFFFFILKFFNLRSHNFSNFTNAYSFGYFFTIALCVSLLFWLAKRSANLDKTIAASIFKLLYCIVSFFILKLIIENIDILFLFDISGVVAYSSTHIWILLFTACIVAAIFFIPYVRKSNFDLVIYCRVAVKTLAAYFSIIVLLFLIGVLLKYFSQGIDYLIHGAS